MARLNARHKSLGMLWVIYGVICTVKAVFIFVNLNNFTLMWGALLNRVPDPFTWMSMFHVWIIGAIVLLIGTALVSFGAAGSLLVGSRPSRAITLIAGFFAIISGPLGITIGVYTWIIFVPQLAVDDYRLPTSA
jgi:hypothetical protein